jgi:pyruvate,water dikinase
LAEVAERFKHAMSVHFVETMLAQATFDQVVKVTAKAGRPTLENRLVSATADVEELEVARDLWELSRDRLGLDAFLARHGYHGPNEGELSARSWREDPSPVTAAAARYATEADQNAPTVNLERQRVDRDAAFAELSAATRGLRRWWARRVVASACAHVPRREVGKAAFLQLLDVGRYVGRRIGTELVGRDQLEEADDVFYLTLEEILTGTSLNWRPTVEFRKERRREYQGLQLPSHWIGDPVPVAATKSDLDSSVSITGIPASPGTAQGTARVIVNALDCAEPLGRDEILVTVTTDPSWVSMFMAAGGIVIDVGAPMSHAAIVARALGVPCVINTGDGTRRIRHGDQIRIDGDAGRVDILSRAHTRPNSSE